MSDEYSSVWTESGLEKGERSDRVAVLDYYAPTSLEEAERLKQSTKGYHYLAGGTILNWKGAPGGKGVIDLQHLQLDAIEITDNNVRIEAMVTIQAIAEHQELPEVLRKAAGLFSSKNVRNMATAGGTATGNFFVSDLLPILLAFQAEIEYFQKGEKATHPLSDWLQEKPGIICAILLNKLQRKVILRQEKISKMDFPLIVTSLGVDMAEGTIAEPVLAISGASGRIVISDAGTVYLQGKRLHEIDVKAFNDAVQQDVQPTENVKATARVKRSIIAEHLKQIVADLRELNPV